MWTRHRPTRTSVLAALSTFLCLAAFRLGAQVPASMLEQDARLAQLAAEAATRGPATPIPLTGEGGRVFGVVYDRYLIGVMLGRAQIAAGGTADPARISTHEVWQSRGTVVVAYPINCDGRPNRPLAIRWQSSAQVPVQPSILAGPMRGTEAQSILPGIGLPDEALVVNFRNALPTGASVAIEYAGQVCRGAATSVVLPYATAPSIELIRAFSGIKLPDEFASMPSPTTVRLRVTVDAAGRARWPEQVQGPTELGAVAIAALNARTFPPATTNGVPTPMNIVVPFVFTSTGAPAPPAPFTPTPPPGGRGTSMTALVQAPAPSTPTTPVPPAPPGQTDQQMARLAAEVAQKGDATPVPLDAAGPARHGVIFDRFLVGVVKARAAVRFGTPIDPASAPASLVQEDLIAVAYPLDCDGRTVTPLEVEMSMGGTSPGPLRATGEMLAGGALTARLPGVDLPAGAAGRAFQNAAFSQNLEVRVTYSGPACSSDRRTLTMPIQWVRGQGLPRQPALKLPAGASSPSPTQVRLRGLVDLDGAYRFPTLAEGPAELAVAAVTAASQWRFQPYRANGVPSPQVLITPLTFTTSGMPEAMPVGPPPPSGPPATASGPPIMSNLTVGGRPIGGTTPDEPGLSAATSKCEIASDASYGLTQAGAVKVGGGMTQGPVRARQYLTALRGPSGQGLSIARRGATMDKDAATILDVYAVTYAGQTAPILIYVNQYAEGPLKAPQGLVCAVAVK